MNIYDIARLSGVSIATVQSGKWSPNVSEKTKEKVLAVIEKNQNIRRTYLPVV